MPKNSPEAARTLIFETIENQLRENSPPEVSQALERLLVQGQSREAALKLIGCVLAEEIFSIMKHNKPFDNERYVSNLNRLPILPWD